MNPEDIAAQIAAELQKQQRAQMTHAAPVDRGPQTPTQRFRAMAQGLTFGSADEAEAYLRSKLTGENYDAALADVRGKLEQYKGDRPWEALGYEVGGAALPAIAASVFSGGAGGAATTARFFPTMAKLMGVGALEGGAYAFNTGEGGFSNRAQRVIPGAVGGAVASGATYAAARGASRVVGDFLDYTGRKLDGRASRRVQDELRRIADDSGMTPDEILERVGRGELMAEMSPMLRSVARDYYARSRGAAETLSKTFSTRADDLRADTMKYLQGTLTGSADDNVLRAVNASDEAFRKSAGQEYNAIFRDAPPLADDVVETVKSSLARVPEAGDDVRRIYTAETGKRPFFEIGKDGTVTFQRPPTLEDAEVIRRGIQTATARQFASGGGGVGTAYKSVEQNLRQALDEASKPLAGVRAKWSNLERAREAFEEGRKALSRSPDELAIAFEEASKNGDAAVASFRAGVVDAFRRKSSTGSRQSIPRNMLDESTREGSVLRTIFPEDNLDELLGRAGRASNAQAAKNKILGGSETAVSRGRAEQSGPSILDDVIDAGSGSPLALARLASSAFKAMRPSLSDAELQQLAKLMVESNPDLLRRAMTDSTALAQVNALASQFLNASSRAAGGMGGAAVVPTADALLR